MKERRLDVGVTVADALEWRSCWTREGRVGTLTEAGVLKEMANTKEPSAFNKEVYWWFIISEIKVSFNVTWIFRVLPASWFATFSICLNWEHCKRVDR